MNDLTKKMSDFIVPPSNNNDDTFFDELGVDPQIRNMYDWTLYIFYCMAIVFLYVLYSFITYYITIPSIFVGIALYLGYQIVLVHTHYPPSEDTTTTDMFVFYGVCTLLVGFLYLLYSLSFSVDQWIEVIAIVTVVRALTLCLR